jgi:hypothetical protein
VQDSVEERGKEHGEDFKREQQHPEQHADERQPRQQPQDEARGPEHDGHEHVGPEHLRLAAHGLLFGDADGVGRGYVGPRHQDVGREAVFIGAHDAEHKARDRDERPQEDPEGHPGEAARNVPEALLRERGEQIGRAGLEPRAVAVEEDHGHAGLEGGGDHEPGRRHGGEAGPGRAGQKDAQQRDPPQADRPFA